MSAAAITAIMITTAVAAMSKVSVEMASAGGATEGEIVGVTVDDAVGVDVGIGLTVDVGVGEVVGCADAAPIVMYVASCAPQ